MSQKRDTKLQKGWLDMLRLRELIVFAECARVDLLPDQYHKKQTTPNLRRGESKLDYLSMLRYLHLNLATLFTPMQYSSRF